MVAAEGPLRSSRLRRPDGRRTDCSTTSSTDSRSSAGRPIARCDTRPSSTRSRYRVSTATGTSSRSVPAATCRSSRARVAAVSAAECAGQRSRNSGSVRSLRAISSRVPSQPAGAFRRRQQLSHDLYQALLGDDVGHPLGVLLGERRGTTPPCRGSGGRSRRGRGRGLLQPAHRRALVAVAGEAGAAPSRICWRRAASWSVLTRGTGPSSPYVRIAGAERPVRIVGITAVLSSPA